MRDNDVQAENERLKLYHLVTKQNINGELLYLQNMSSHTKPIYR